MASIGACIYRQQACGLTAVARISNVLDIIANKNWGVLSADTRL
jgi:hypothetical protein